MFISIELILCLLNASNQTYHDTAENKLFAEIEGGLTSKSLCQMMDKLQPKTGKPLPIFVISILSI